MNSPASPVRVGVIGLGFMGATHVAAYQAAAGAGYPCVLAAVCDRKESRRRGELWDVGGNAVSDMSEQKRAFDPQQVKGYETPQELLADDSIDLVSICTRTDTHVELAIEAVGCGKHVLVEKPVSLSVAEIERLRDAARAAGKHVMPAMCIRFWPQWAYLKARVDDGELGACRSATFQRLASAPNWSSSFYRDGSKSGGALFDLHIHDADFVRYCFGEPQSVCSAGRVGETGAVDHVTTAYHFSGTDRSGKSLPAHVVAEGGWDQHPGFAFRMRYVAVFEKATLDYDLTREHPLLLCRDGKAEPVKVDALSGYDGQVRWLVERIVSGKARLADTRLLDDASAVTRLLAAEHESCRTRRPVALAGEV
jgi:predicted dehydrogenase